MRQIRNVETVARQHVAVAERIVAPAHRRIDPFLDVGVDRTIDVLKTPIASSVTAHVDFALDHKHPVRTTHFHVYSGGFGKGYPFECLDRHLVVDQHYLPAAGEQPTYINFMRTSHDTNAVAV